MVFSDIMLLVHAILFLPIITGSPTSFAASGSNEDSDSAPLIFFDKGNVGVNFLGFRASAGLGGLLTGNLADGGLHAEAGTPFGQNAGAGLGGTVDASGNSAGYKYSYATRKFDPLNILASIRRNSKFKKETEVETLD